MSIDLHCHSHVSDGKFPPSEVVRLAHANGATMLSLTDHDHIGGLAEAHLAAQDHGVNLINGVEISVTWRARTVHIVGLNFDRHHAGLPEKLAQIRSGRLTRLQKIAERLAKKAKIDGVYEGALALAENPDTVSRTHIAQFLCQNGHVADKDEAFKKWLGDGKPACVKHEWATLAEAVAMIHTAGGVAVIAHPARYRLSATAMRALLEEFIALGGQAIEVACSVHSLNERLNFALLANRYGLYASRGSDFHGQGEYGCIIGRPPELPLTCRPVWQLFEHQEH
ncbi:MAG: PHP domain-containing protein [Neisseria sp.]|nr:PHP domain-containing protein [Neisseria sp.]